jgi:hypothetical protein
LGGVCGFYASSDDFQEWNLGAFRRNSRTDPPSLLLFFAILSSRQAASSGYGNAQIRRRIFSRAVMRFYNKRGTAEFAISPRGILNVFTTESMSNDPRECRSERFSMAWKVRYSVLRQRKAEDTEIGQTVNISSAGVLFTSDQGLRLGQLLELSVSWPVRLDNKAALKLIARGRVVRVEPCRVAMQIQQYKFRTHRSAKVLVTEL